MSQENVKDGGLLNNHTNLVRSLSKSNRSTPPLSSPPSSFPPSPANNNTTTANNNSNASTSINNLPKSASANDENLNNEETSNAHSSSTKDVPQSSNPTYSPNKSNTSNIASTQSVPPPPQQARRSSFGLNFLSSFTNSIRPNLQSSGSNPGSGSSSVPQRPTSPRRNGSSSGTTNANNEPYSFMSNSPTIANLQNYTSTTPLTYANEENNIDPIHETSNDFTVTQDNQPNGAELNNLSSSSNSDTDQPPSDSINNSNDLLRNNTISQPSNRDNDEIINIVNSPEDPLSSSNLFNSEAIASSSTAAIENTNTNTNTESNINDGNNGMDKDGFYSVRLTPLIDHSSSASGLYFAPVIRKIKATSNISIGRYTEKNKSAAHAPQGSSAPIVFKSKVVSRTHALFQCNEDGQWFLKDCKSSSGTFLNHIRLSPASQDSTLMPLIDGDIIQLGMDYRGGTEEVYRCVKMRCEFNKSWQRKVNQFNLEIHQKLKNLAIGNTNNNDTSSMNKNPIGDALSSSNKDELSECAICLLKLEPCQALFISPCSHSWHYKCIRPIIIKSYPQFYCPNCRSMCDLETDIEDDD